MGKTCRAARSTAIPSIPITDNAPTDSEPAIIVMAGDGFVVQWSDAAERMFGHASADAVGRELGDLLVPGEYRARHRAALTRYRETGEATVLGVPLDLQALHADGSLIPVELTISELSPRPRLLFKGRLRIRQQH